MLGVNADSQVSTSTPLGLRRASFHELSERIDRLAWALKKLGVQRGDRVGTFAWNNQEHFELYIAVPCVGAVLHTINIRLFTDQLRYIIDHAEDQVIFVDASLTAVLAPLAQHLKKVRHYVVIGADRDDGALPGALSYDELLAEAPSEPFAYPQLQEREAAALCYTSGTTGNPKGVLYSHRSVALHSTAALISDALGLCRQDKALVVVPMFHANAWGIPHAAALCGADLLLPDRFLQAEALAKLIEQERPTIMGCVPTIFADLLRYADSNEVDLSCLRNAACGGSAVPKQLMRDFEERHQVRIYQAWGMTETSPVATYSRPSTEQASSEEHWDQRARQGTPLPWVEIRLVGEDGMPVPSDGQTSGEIEVRGPWIAAAYYNDDSGEERFDDGWLRTGDIATADGHGSLQISDRVKDVIKSGGEWISSVALENELMAHPDVLEAAVIAKPDERWGERPLCCVVLREGAHAGAADLLEHLRPRVASWWLPDEFAFISQVPKTSVGKFDKKALRHSLEDGTLAGRVSVRRA